MKRQASLLHAAFSVTCLVLLGKVLGFAREAMIAAYFGTTAETDAFFFAHAMPSMMFPAVGNSLALAFTALYVKRCTEQGDREGDHFASRSLVATLLLGILLSIAGVLLSPWLVPLLAPGFSGVQLNLAVQLTRLSMGAFTLTLLQYLLGAILNSKGFFLGAQIAGLLYNALIISVTAVFGSGQSMVFLMMTVIGGMVIQVTMLCIFCCRRMRGTMRDLSPFHRDIGQLFYQALPILLGNSVVQLNNIVDKALGSTLTEGALSALSYASSLNTMVTDVFIISLSTVLFPALTRDAASGDMDHYNDTLIQSLSGLSLLLVPISCITVLDSHAIVEIVYGRGNFQQQSIALTALALACYAPRFVFAGIREVLTRAFFALQDTKTPMVISAVGVGCNILFSILFVRKLGMAGIALGTVVSVFVIAVLLLWKARVRLAMLPLRIFFLSLAKQLAAGAVLILALVLFQNFTQSFTPLLRFAVDTVTGVIIYGAVALLLREKQIWVFARTITDYVKKKK